MEFIFISAQNFDSSANCSATSTPLNGFYPPKSAHKKEMFNWLDERLNFRISAVGMRAIVCRGANAKP